ncbi:MAG: hypothetical protein IPO09_06735 [Anaeromyxobacter sp.]|nr:hypothetical protein [Anaeromyxobacter sp.]MBL0277363.1 hypothetical protein [Anaeromyxobacter sp.]
MRHAPSPTGPDAGASLADPTLLDELSALTPEERRRWNDRAATASLELRLGCAAEAGDDGLHQCPERPWALGR